jgi:hypothetical protein
MGSIVWNVTECQTPLSHRIGVKRLTLSSREPWAWSGWIGSVPAPVGFIEVMSSQIAEKAARV